MLCSTSSDTVMRWYHLVGGAVFYALLSVLAFAGGLVLQNLLMPSARTAAAGWLLYFVPVIILLSSVIGAALTLLVLRSSPVRKRFWTMLLISILYAVVISWGYWMVWITMLVATLVFYRVVSCFSLSANVV